MRNKLLAAFLALIAFGFTTFVFLNTYEVVANKDIAFAVSLHRLAAQNVMNNLVREFAVKPGADQPDTTYSKLDNIQYFEIPALSIRVSTEEGRKVNGKWYQRPGMAHYVGLNKDSRGVTVDYLVYTVKSWRTIPDPTQIEPGMEVEFFHKGGATSSFHVVEQKKLPLDRSFVVDKTEDRQILLLIDDPHDSAYFGFSLALTK